MDVVVTGATGNVGSRVVSALVNDSRVDRVVGIARRPPPLDTAPYDHSAFRWVSADVRDGDLRSAFGGMDTVVHLAWMFHPTRRPVVTWSGNVIGTQRVLDAAVSAGVGAVVCASSVGAYSPAPGDARPGAVPGERDQPVDERHPTHSLPAAAYGRQKSYVERMLDAFELEHREIRVVRPRSAFVFQRRAAPEQRRIFAGPLLPGRIAGSRLIPVLPVPRGLRFQAVHADDAAAAYVEAACRPVQGAFNLAGDGVIDRRALGRLLGASTFDVPVGVVRRSMAAAFRARLAPAEPGLFELFMSLPLMDTERARRELAWAPSWNGADAVAEFLTGLAHPSGAPTPPLHPQAGGPARVGEFATGVGGENR